MIDPELNRTAQWAWPRCCRRGDRRRNYDPILTLTGASDGFQAVFGLSWVAGVHLELLFTGTAALLAMTVIGMLPSVAVRTTQ